MQNPIKYQETYEGLVYLSNYAVSEIKSKKKTIFHYRSNKQPQKSNTRTTHNINIMFIYT